MPTRAAKDQSRHRARLEETLELRTRLRDAEEVLRAINSGEVDAILRPGSSGEQVYTLKGADHVYRVMVETMSEGAITLSSSGVILYANRRFADLLMMDLDKVMGRRIQEFAEPDAQAVLTDLLLRSQDEALRCSIELKASSGAPVAVYVAMRRLNTEDMQCTIAIVTDVSELKRSEAELRRADEQFRLAIEAAPTGILLTSLSGCITLVNAQIETVFGYPREELFGRHIEMLLPERLRKEPSLRSAFFGEPPASATAVSNDLYGLRRDGSEVPIDISFTPLHTSQGELILVSVVDLSSRREVDRLRTEFVSMVSHELRTPLTAISGSLALLHSGAMGTLPDRTTAMVKIALKNSGRLERIINDILDIGTLESGTMNMEMTSVPLADLVQQSIEASAGYAEMCKVRFVLEGSASGDRTSGDRVMVDPHRLVQVIANLLSNAAKFSPSGGDVLIRVSRVPKAMRVEVEDSGPGIPEAFQNRVFEKFAQADSTARRRFEGAGLGLSIARKLIEAMGGLIGFNTEVGEGTIFYVEIPLADLEARGADADVSQADVEIPHAHTPPPVSEIDPR